MDIGNIIDFLSPITFEQGGGLEPLPIFFFALICGIFIFTIIATKLNANAKNWETNWTRDQNKKITKLDIEQGSVIDLSQLIATKSEKVADVMPGIILIIGLLGTFIGLGLALDKASAILGSANPDSMNDSMAQLMGMMEGLGTKFKTSTWGLMAFLLLKSILGAMDYEHKRLRWCSEKINTELEKSRNDKQEKDLSFQSSLLDTIVQLESGIIGSQNNQLDQVTNNHKEKLAAGESSTHSLIMKMEEVFSKQEQLMNNQLLIMKELSEKQNNLFITKTDDVSKKFFTLLDELKQSGINNSSSLNDSLTTLHRLFSSQHSESISKISENHQQSLEVLKNTIEESRLSRQAMERFVNENSRTVESLQNSAENMSKASSEMGGSAAKLQTVINELSRKMTELLQKLKDDLGGTIQNMDKSFSGNMAEMTSNLGKTIEDMNESFKNNMTEMTSNLNHATSDISNAVNHLSSEVGTTMDNVSENIRKAMEMQTKSMTLFSTMTQALEEKVTAMTGLVNKLSEDILDGLAKISESNRSVVSLNKKYNTSTEQVQALVQAISDTANNVKENISIVKDFKESIKDLVLFNSNTNELLARLDNSNKEVSELIKVLDNKPDSSVEIISKLEKIYDSLSDLTSLEKSKSNASDIVAKLDEIKNKIGS